MKIGGKIHRFESCSSTNDLAKQLAEKNAVHGHVVVCGEQTRGKGTKGRTWISMLKKGLYFSVILFPSRPDLSLLPFSASLAIREAVLNELNILIDLKWPNDLMYKGRKIGGVLCESSFSGKEPNYSVIGIGINLKHKKNDFPADLQKRAGSLEMFYKRSIDREKILWATFRFLDKWYRAFLKREDHRILSKYLEASFFHEGEELKADVGGDPVSGVFKGVDKQGKIILDMNGKEERFLSGEILIKKSGRGLE